MECCQLAIERAIDCITNMPNKSRPVLVLKQWSLPKRERIVWLFAATTKTQGPCFLNRRNRRRGEYYYLEERRKKA